MKVGHEWPKLLAKGEISTEHEPFLTRKETVSEISLATLEIFEEILDSLD